MKPLDEKDISDYDMKYLPYRSIRPLTYVYVIQLKFNTMVLYLVWLSHPTISLIIKISFE